MRSSEEEDRYRADRRLEMVERQIERRGVKDDLVLEAIRKVPRHLFMEEKNAHRDAAFPIGKGQTISQPYIVALMTELLELSPRSKVLEIGTGCGYQTAVLSTIAAEVFTVEIILELAREAWERFDRLGYKNVRRKVGNGYDGWLENSPYDRILVTAAPAEIPSNLVEQLKVGGKMVLPVGDSIQNLVVLTKRKNGIDRRYGEAVRFVPMVDR